MDFRFKKHLITSALMGGMLLAPEMQAATYTVSQLLNSAGGSTFFNATVINASGQVVGFDGWGYGGITVADLWQPGSATPTLLGSLGINAKATAINDGGQVVGSSNAYSLTHATLWQPGSTTPIDLGTLGGGDPWNIVIGGNSYATGINASGQVIGYSNSYSGTYGSGGCNYCGIQHAVLWEPGSTTPIDLGTPYNGYGSSKATGINDGGQVVGYGNSGNGGFEAFFWQSSSSTPIAMTSLGGGLATAINNSGQVVGISNPSSIYYGHAVLWQSDLSTPIELGDLNWGMSYAADINNSGQVVGNAVTYANINGHYSSTTHATLWESGSTTAIDLNTLVSLSSGYLREAMSINDKGQIIAIDSNNHINLLTPNVAPIPIPATIWLFGSTLAGFIGFNRRQKMQ